MQSSRLKTEKRLIGRSVSRGTGTGAVLCLHGTKRQYFKSSINADQKHAEIGRFRAAIAAAAVQLNEIVSQSSGFAERAEIFETHLQFLKDRYLIDKIEKEILDHGVNAEWAVGQIIDEFSSKYKRLSDKHLQEKHIDLEDVGLRLIAALGGEKVLRTKVEPNNVVVASELNPSTLIEIAACKPAAIVTENGGWTSHAFILARELGIPSVTGIADILRKTETGDRMYVDGFLGEIVINPAVDKGSRETGASGVNDSARGLIDAGPSFITSDGHEISISVNLDVSTDRRDFPGLTNYGIGLYRSEYLFNRFDGYPSEEIQFQKYCEVLELVKDSRVKIRTFDLSAGETEYLRNRQEKNPALGLRGIRLSLKDIPQFRVQIRALLRAGNGRKLDIVIPLVSCISEIRKARSIIKEEHDLLEKSGNDPGNPRLGVMVELPAAVFIIEEILKEVDFIDIGTNDLVQYLLAVDRDNEMVAENFSSLHPAVLRALKMILEATGNSGTETIVCGEMAAAPLYVPLLVGLGANCLSMNPASIQRIAGIIEEISFEKSRVLAEKVLKFAATEEIEAEVRRFCSEQWPNISEYAVFSEQRD